MKKVYGKSEGVRVRQMNNTTSAVLEIVSPKSGLEYIRMTAVVSGHKWYVVKVGNKEGYIREDVGVLKDEIVEVSSSDPWKNVIITGSVFPSAPINVNQRISLNETMRTEYLPAMEQVMASEAKGFKLLVTVMAHKEGFKKGTRSYRTNNPGNIGNTDSGKNVELKTLVDGIARQRDFIRGIAEGRNRNFPLNKEVFLKPFYSAEIDKNRATYKMSPYLPGYRFTYTGQLDQFVKIYATGARAGNSYLSMIISYFRANGIVISPDTTIQEIIKMS